MKSSIILVVSISLVAVPKLSAATHYVSLESTNPTPPYTNWCTAATNIQDAVNVAANSDVVLVTNGVYSGGVTVSNRLTLLSVNGPYLTAINGRGLYQCIWLTNGASLTGFTLTNGHGGVFCASTNASLTNCMVVGNYSSGSYAGVVYGGTLYNCTLSGNWDRGAAACTLYNCTVAGNSAGVHSCTLYNCTVTGNSGIGAWWSTLYNCIVYFNTAQSGAANFDNSTLNYCCTTPLPTNGVGNIALDPQLASASHLSADSPCIGAGSPDYATGSDIDGEPWLDPPSIGCDEFHHGAVTGPLKVALVAHPPYVAVGYEVSLTALIEGRVTDSVWDFGDGDVAINQPYVTHSWTQPGEYEVGLWAFNESNPGGVRATATVRVAIQPALYVAADSFSPRSPYATWATAATSIQQAMAATSPGAEIIVSNGVYRGISVDEPMTLVSANGPQVTVIEGGISLTSGASLTGFTVTNGNTWESAGGGVRCSSTNAFVTNCVIVGNSAPGGGGAFGCTLYNCTLAGNSARHSWWTGSTEGGGAYACTLYNCTLSGNSACYGGGASACTLYNCTLTGNSAVGYVTYVLPLWVPEWHPGQGGGAGRSTLYNCTLSGNSADIGGGASGCTLYNCINWFNAAANHAECVFNYCCTTPLSDTGVGNIELDPQLASASHLSAGSPCRGAGSAAYATGTDIDGEAWLNPPSIGCDEYHPGGLTGQLTLELAANYTNVAVGYPVSFTALISGRASASAWDFGDSVVVSNQPYASHAWTAPGEYRVVLRAYNESQPGGVSATSSIHVVPGVMYVARTSTNPQSPYTSWATAATNIQQAVDAALAGILPGTSVVLVTNGMYAGPVRVIEPITLRSANGPQFTIIDGGRTNQCVQCSGSPNLVGFTLTNGSCGVYGSGVASNCVITGMSGNGADGATLFNCALTRNSDIGTYSCTLHNCTLTGNSGLGAVDSTLYNCTLTGNAGGGVSGGTLYNSIAYFNTASGAANYDYSSALNYCCTTPLPATGIGNITNAPLFIDDASGSLRSQFNSPCINAGNNGYLGSYDWNLDVWFTNQFDLDGNPRVVSGTVDVGAYEYQGAGSRISYAWLQQYGLATDGSADFIDFDVDGHNNWQEWRCGTVPTNTSSALRLLAALPTGTNVTVSWQSAAGINYLLERSPNLAVPFTLLATNIVGQAGTTTYADTNTTGPGPFFYRVGVTWP